MNNDELLVFSLWSFTITFLFDVVYLAFFLKRFRLQVFVSVTIIVSGAIIYSIRQENANRPWESLSALVITFILLGLACCVILAATTWAAISALKQHDYNTFFDLRVFPPFILHIVALSLSVLNFNLILYLIDRL